MKIVRNNPGSKTFTEKVLLDRPAIMGWFKSADNKPSFRLVGVDGKSYEVLLTWEEVEKLAAKQKELAESNNVLDVE